MNIVDQIREQIEDSKIEQETAEIRRSLTPEQKLVIAQAAHEMNRIWCQSLGDTSQSPWNEAPEWQRNSALAGVEAICSGKVKEPHQSHDSWMAQKLREGWRYGPVKDTEKREHPCLLPFNDLPARQQVKDCLFLTTVMTFVEAHRYVSHWDKKNTQKSEAK